jgi:GT2 family glycosyltransferase
LSSVAIVELKPSKLWPIPADDDWSNGEIIDLKLSIIIVTWNCRGQLENCLRSLGEVGLNDYETIVIDARSTDSTPAYLGSLRDSELAKKLNLRVVLRDHKGNWAMNNQDGLRMAKGDLLVLSNPDIIFNPDFKKTVDLAAKKPMAFFSCQLYNPRGMQYPCKQLSTTQIFYRFSIIGKFVERFFPGFGFRHFMYPVEAGTVLIVDHLSASIFMTSRKVLETLGGRLWAPTFTFSAADSDAFRRGKDFGIPCLHDGRVRMIHEGRQSGGDLDKEYAFRFLEDAYGFMEYSRRWGHPNMMRFLLLLDSMILPIWLMMQHRGFSFSESIHVAAFQCKGLFLPSAGFELA